jgi:pimeloyl-ACP methyl ester carboxylesterase
MNHAPQTHKAPLFKSACALLVASFGSLTAAAAPIEAGSCKLAYPIVMSHHWGTKAICSETDEEGVNAGVTSEVCEATQQAKYCRGWSADVDDPSDMDCTGGWGVPKAELDLPPRDYNVQDPNLVRDLSSNQRYYSPEIIKALEACGNQVFLSDKPAFAGYRDRAISLKATVKQALKETGAQKVVIFGHSQGSQDARYLIGALPLDETGNGDKVSGRLMGEQIAALVSTAGEPFGAEAAGLGLKALYATNKLTGSGWLDMQSDPLLKSAGRAAFDQSFWKLGSYDAQTQKPLFEISPLGEPYYVISAADKAPLSFTQRYMAYLRSMTELSPSYMRGESGGWGWSDLLRILQIQPGFASEVPPAVEAASPTRYISYAAKVNNWSDRWGSAATHRLISLTGGANDGYVSVDSQRFDRLPFEAEHVHTLSGQGSGYHHMFFTGENPIYGPLAAADQDPAYPGGSADFYVQAARDLVARGFGASTVAVNK